jgi:hypothetical protein
VRVSGAFIQSSCVTTDWSAFAGGSTQPQEMRELTPSMTSKFPKLLDLRWYESEV